MVKYWGECFVRLVLYILVEGKIKYRKFFVWFVYMSNNFCCINCGKYGGIKK